MKLKTPPPPRPRLNSDHPTVRMDFLVPADWKRDLLDYCNRHELPMSLVLREAVSVGIASEPFTDHALKVMAETASARTGVRSPGVPINPEP